MYKVRGGGKAPPAPARQSAVKRVTASVTDKETGEVTEMPEKVEEVGGSVEGQGPWGALRFAEGLTISSADYHSVRVDVSVEMPVSRCTNLKRADEALRKVRGYVQSALLGEVADAVEVLRSLPKKARR